MSTISISADVLRRALAGEITAQQEARALLHTAKPTTNLMGRWVTHPKHGDVMIISEKVDPAGRVYVVLRVEENPDGTATFRFPLDELTFPNQARNPQDVPVGEPWMVEAHGDVAIGYRNDPEDRYPWSVTYRDCEGDEYVEDARLTLIARLALAPTDSGLPKPDDEQEFDPAYAYTDRKGDIWRYMFRGWRWKGLVVSAPYDTPPAEGGPYTRIEKEETNELG